MFIEKEKICCANCKHCDYFEYFDDEDEFQSHWDCTLDNPEFDYENGSCDDYE